MDHEATIDEYIAYSQGWYDATGNPFTSGERENVQKMNAAFREWMESNGCTFSQEVEKALSQ